MFFSRDSILLHWGSWAWDSSKPPSKLTINTVAKAPERLTPSESSSTKLNQKDECTDCGSALFRAAPLPPPAAVSACSSVVLRNGTFLLNRLILVLLVRWEKAGEPEIPNHFPDNGFCLELTGDSALVRSVGISGEAHFLTQISH